MRFKAASIADFVKFSAGKAVLILCALPWLPAPAQSISELAERATRAMQSQDYAAAEVAYQQLASIAPSMAELQSNLGLACLLQGKAPCAAQAFESALEIDSELFLPNYSMAQMRFQQGRYLEGREFAEEAVRLQPEQSEARHLLIAILVGLDRFDQAVENYRALLRRDPTDSESLYGLGSVYMELSRRVTGRLRLLGGQGYEHLVEAERDAGDPEWTAAALQSYRDAIKHGVEVSGPRIAYARLRLTVGEWDSARDSLLAELRLDSNSYEGRFWLALVALHAADTQRCVRLLNEAVRIRPEFFKPLPELPVEIPPEVAADLRRRLLSGEPSFGSAYLLGSLPGADASARDADRWIREARSFRDRWQASLDAESTDSSSVQEGLDLLIRKRYERGLEALQPLSHSGLVGNQMRIAVSRALLRVGRYDDIAALYRGRAPETAEEAYLLGTSYKRAAVEMLERMVEVDPDSPRGHQVLGDSFLAQGKTDSALEEYERAADLDPINSRYRYLVARVLHSKAEYGRAVEALDKVIALNSLNAEAYILRGESLAQLGQLERAIESIQRGIDLNPSLAQAHLALGRIYRLAGNDKAAIEHLKLGAAGDDDGTAHYQLYLVYRKLNMAREASAALARSQEIRRAGRPDSE